MTTFSDENSPATITLGSDVAGDFFQQISLPQLGTAIPEKAQKSPCQT